MLRAAVVGLVGARVERWCFLFAVMGGIDLEGELLGRAPVQRRVDGVFGDDAQRLAGVAVL
ncbi:hypothetical protein D3C84_1098950 [compost metagenome]